MMQLNSLTKEQLTELALVLRSQRHRPLPLLLFLALCFNLVLAPAVLAATGGTVSRLNAYAIGILGLVTVGLAIYLMTVMLQPQRF
ncbi:MAG: potassium-transporting ATPase subunit F [Chroococcidiopsidaceae cyanobacterium CP_BM_ER_R8_30]|nr:potassium-transporting ATPase subunit F [Chroococcidiopsidaceae cyanobacterium CP_BM_ER_R8_30]